MAGKYGPYVTHGGINATLPNTAPPETVDLETAVALLRERAARGPSKGARKAPAKKAAKPAAEKLPGKAVKSKAAKPPATQVKPRRRAVGAA
jgi:DNA topoisomerase-1